MKYTIIFALNAQIFQTLFFIFQLVQEKSILPDTLQLFLDTSEHSRLLVEKYLNLTRPLYFDYTHLVCRTAIDGNFIWIILASFSVSVKLSRSWLYWLSRSYIDLQGYIVFKGQILIFKVTYWLSRSYTEFQGHILTLSDCREATLTFKPFFFYQISIKYVLLIIF